MLVTPEMPVEDTIVEVVPPPVLGFPELVKESDSEGEMIIEVDADDSLLVIGA